MTFQATASEASAAAPRRGGSTFRASLSASVVALLLLAAALCTLFQKNLVSTLTQQGWGRELYGMSAALTKLRFGVGGAAVDWRLFGTLMRNGITSEPDPALGVRYPDNFRDPRLLQSALVRAGAIDLPPPRGTDTNGEYPDLGGFSGEDTGLATYAYVAFEAFGLNIPALTYLYFFIVTASLVLYGIGHWRSAGAMGAIVAVCLALYLVVCADFVNFISSSRLFPGFGIDVKDPRFLGTIAAVPLLHLLALWTRSSYRVGPLDYVVVVAQAAIFAFALQLRSSVAWVVLALSTFWLIGGAIALQHGRSLRSLCDWRQSRSAPMPIILIAVVLSAQLLAAATLHPVYRATGDVPRHVFWQVVLSSLQLNPQWVKKYGPSVNNAEDDAMPAEVAHIAIMKLPPEQRLQYQNRDGSTKRTALENFSRRALADFLWNDPKFVFQTFFVDKPMRAWMSERQFFGGLFAGLPIWNALVLPAAIVFLVFLVIRNADASGTLLRTAGVMPLFLVFSLLPNWLAFTNPTVMIDHFVWIVFLMVLLFVIVATLLFRSAIGAKQASEMIAPSK